MLGLVKGVVMTKTKQVLDLIKIRAGVDDAWMWRWIGINFKAIIISMIRTIAIH